jgi:hypothetical protein
MYRTPSLHNKNTRLRNIIIAAVAIPAVLFAGISAVRFIFGSEISVAENSSGLVPGTGGQVLYAYVEAGEIVEAKLTAITGGGQNTEGGPFLPTDPGDVGPSYCTSLAENLQWIYCAPGYPVSAHPELAKVTISGPNGVSYSANFDENFNINDPAMLAVSAESLPSDSTGPAVWRITIDQDPDLDMRFRWEVNVVGSGTKKPGRIWADEVRISQINSKEMPVNPDLPVGSPGRAIDLVYYAQRSDGYRYKITQKGYNGFGSTLKLGAFGVGLPEETNCASAYGSVELSATQGSWPNDVEKFGMPVYVPDPAGRQGKSLDSLPKCSGMASYRIFFEEPDSTMPEDAAVAGWDGSVFTDLYREDPKEPEITAKFVSTSNYVGKVVVDSHGTYFGNAVLEWDSDGNSTDNFVEIAAFGITENGAEISMDGTKNNHGGEKIPLNTLVKGRIVLEYLGEIHIISLDIEMRAGGIEVERQNGSETDQYQLFWNDDRPWLMPERATVTSHTRSALPTGTNSQGGVHGWNMPDTYAACSSTFTGIPWGGNITEGMRTIFMNTERAIPCPFDKIGHFNERTLQAWGDNRAIEDWTFDIYATELWRQEALDSCDYSNEDDDMCFSYIFTSSEEVDICKMTNAEFVQYLNSLPDSDQAAALAKRAACPQDKPKPSCTMTLAEMVEVIGDYDEAAVFWQNCQSGGIEDPPPYRPPTSGGRRLYGS